MAGTRETGRTGKKAGDALKQELHWFPGATKDRRKKRRKTKLRGGKKGVNPAGTHSGSKICRICWPNGPM